MQWDTTVYDYIRLCPIFRDVPTLLVHPHSLHAMHCVFVLVVLQVFSWFQLSVSIGQALQWTVIIDPQKEDTIIYFSLFLHWFVSCVIQDSSKISTKNVTLTKLIDYRHVRPGVGRREHKFCSWLVEGTACIQILQWCCQRCKFRRGHYEICDHRHDSAVAVKGWQGVHLVGFPWNDETTFLRLWHPGVLQ